MSWQQTAADDRGDEPLAQPALGIGVLAGPRPPGRVPVRGQVPGDQVRAGPLQARRISRQPLGHPGQLGGELVLGHRLALPPPPALIPHRPPPVPLPPRRVHRDPALQLHHHTTVTPRSRAPSPGREDGTAGRPGRVAVAMGRVTPVRDGCGFSVGIMARTGADCPMGSLSFCALRR